MSDAVKKQQGSARKPGRPKGSTTKKNTGTTTAKRQSSTSRDKSRPRRPAYEEEEDMGFMRAEVIIICSFAVAILLFLSNFRLCGVFGDVLRSVQLGLFGMIGYLLPIMLFVGTCFHLSNQGNIHAAVKLAAVIGVFFTLCGLLQLMFGKAPEGASLMEYYTVSSVNGAGGGLVGGALSGLLSFLLGRAGAYLVLVVLLIICMVCITGKSFVSFVQQGSDRAYQYAREDMDRRRELHAQRAEERRLLKEEQRVRGVNLEATALGGRGNRTEEFYEEEGLAEDAFEREFGADPVRKGEPAENEASPADEFRGRIQLPRNYDTAGTVGARQERTEGEAGRLARELEDREKTSEARRECKNEPTPQSRTEQGDCGGAEEEEPIYETIRVQRDRRTLDELDMGVGAPRPVSFEEDISGLQETVYRQEPVSAPAPARDPEKQERDEMPEQKAVHIAPWDTEPEEENIHLDEGSEEPDCDGTSPWDPDPDSSPTSAPKPFEAVQPSMMAAPDTLYQPEGTKRVVTASGKIIETETDLLQKKLEKKREAAEVQAAEVSVAQEIHKKIEEKKEYVFPPTDLLKKPVHNAAFSENEFKATAIKLQQTLHNFGVGVTVTNISCGPSVTRYELLPEQGVKVSKIVSLTDDIKLSLAAADIRIEAPIPGKSAVGIEVPNKENNIVYLRELFESEAFRRHKSRLAFAVGKDIGGQVVVTDIAKMPHLLIAGATGSGKSVCINTLIMSIIYKADPADVKLIMVDPKVVELSVYNGIPHLLIPVVTDPKKASGALNWAVAEMTDRYKKFAECNVRDLKGYNERVAKLDDIDDDKKPKKLPQIVIIIDELADLMMVAPGEVEDSICRLAQLARAAGIHLVIATQRPSVNVITGLIKANVPSRIAFSVSSGVDSRTIIDMNGAEKLLGKGDMLFYPAGFPKPQRVQGAFVSDEEVSRVVEFLTEQGMVAEYSQEVVNKVASPSMDGGSSGADRDELFAQAGAFIIEKDKASIGMLQRAFKIGFNRAARIMDQLAEAGVVGEEEGTKPRKILMSPEQFEEMMEQGY